MTREEAPPEANKQKRRWFENVELWVAFCLGALSLACFIYQVRTVGVHATATEIFLFNSLQFFLNTGFAWFSTRAASRHEFEESLKKFAISAYRRVADIERMIDRLQRRVREMISAEGPSDRANLLIVDAIIADTGQVIRSSISDWADVIGDELLAIERIKRLEREKELLARDETTAKERPEFFAALKKIENTIEALQRTLPPRLALDTKREGRSAYLARRTANWLAEQHAKSDGLLLKVFTGPGYPHGRDPKALKPGETLVARKTDDDALNVQDTNGRDVGRVLNATPVGYEEFAKAFVDCFGDLTPLEFVRITREKDATAADGSSAHFVEFEVRVTQNPETLVKVGEETPPRHN